MGSGADVPMPPLRPRGRPVVLAVLSVVSAAGAFAFAAHLPLGLIGAVLSVMLGHAAVRHARGVGVEERLAGRPLAVAGLVMGYAAVLVASTLAWLLLRPSLIRTPLGEAEVAVASGISSAHGNTPEALAVGQALYSLLALEGGPEAAAGREAPPGAEGYSVHCELREASVAFIVRVPDYQAMDDAARAKLAEKAWDAAYGLARDTRLAEGSQVAVGLRGAFLYGAVMTGTLRREGEIPPLERQDGDRARLAPFFTPEKEPGSFLEGLKPLK